MARKAADRPVTCGEFKSEIRRLDGRLESIDARLSGQDERFQGLDGRLEGLEDKIGDLAGKVGSLAGKVGSLAGKVGSLEGKVGSLEGKVGSLEGTTSRLASGLLKTNDRLDAIERNMATKADFRRIMGAIDSFAARLEAYGRETHTIPITLDALGYAVRDHGKRIQLLESGQA